MDFDEVIDIEGLQHEQHAGRRARKVYKPRSDPRLAMNDNEFVRHFRFSKDSVTRLTGLLWDDLQYENN